MDSRLIRRNADRILYEHGLLDMLGAIGTPHIVGSYKMDMMAWNDLDIDIENDRMSLPELYRLTGRLLETFRPSWYEAKEERTPEGRTVWFHGFEAVVGGELWNVDLWFFDRETIEAAERYCDGIVQSAAASQREEIISIKRELIKRGLYSFDTFHSTDVYRAVLEMGIKNTEGFLERYAGSAAAGRRP